MDEENDDDTEDYKAIFEGLELGTEATRTGIIENAINSKYIELKKDVYYILPGGEYLIDSLMQMNINMDKYKTSTLGQGLKKVYRGEITINDVVDLTKKEINEVFDKRNNCGLNTDTGFFNDVIGTCPICGKNVVKTRFNYGCTGYREGCNFKINFVICKRVISKNMAIDLLKNKKTFKINGFISKDGKPFSGVLVLDNEGKINFDFSN